MNKLNSAFRPAALFILSAIVAVILFGLSGCAHLSGLVGRAEEAQRELAAAVEALDALEKSCAEAEDPDSIVCEKAEQVRKAVDKILSRIPIQ